MSQNILQHSSDKFKIILAAPVTVQCGKLNLVTVGSVENAQLFPRCLELNSIILAHAVSGISTVYYFCINL